MENNITDKTAGFEKWIPFILYIIVTIIYAFRFFKPGQMIFGHDIILGNQYGDVFVNGLLKTGEIPFWNPYSYSGTPCFGALGPFFYPTNIIYSLSGISLPLYYLCEYMLCIFLSGSFMYLYAKNIGLSKTSSFLAGIFFMFSGNIITLMNAGHMLNIQAITYIPIILYFFDKGIQKDTIFYFLLTACFLGIQSYTAGFQIVAYTAVFLFLYLLLKIVFEKKSYNLIGYFMLIAVLVPLIAAVYVIPSNYFFKFSYRAAPTYEYFTSWSFPPMEAITFLLPRFFGFMEATYWGIYQFRITSDYFGILPIILAFLSVFFLIKDKRVLCFTILSIISLLLSLGGYTPLYKILYHFPIISSFRNPSRWLVFFTFFTVLLAGFGIDFIINFADKKYKKEKFIQFNAFKIILIILSACFLMIWVWFSLNNKIIIPNMQTWELIRKKTNYLNIYVLYKMIAGDLFRLAMLFTASTVFILLAFYGKISKYVLTGCLLVLFLADMWYIGLLSVRTVPIPKPDIRQEETIDFLKQDSSLYRVLPVDGFSSENWFMGSKIQSVKGYLISLKNYHDAMDNGVFNNINFLNLLNVKYILTTRNIDYPVFKLVYNQNINIYQNLAVSPRASLFNKIEVNKDRSDYMSKLMSPDFNIKEKLIINEDFEEKLDTVSFNGDEINITAYHPNYITLDVNNPGNSVLLMSEIYYPEWKATVDGKESKIYQADELFRAVYLTKGSHHVEFHYSPKLLYIGTVISIITIFSILIFLIRYKINLK
ncbi:MAG: YfhO family protein [bacterium]|nr:YfhO family protein [bacterium]